MQPVVLLSGVIPIPQGQKRLNVQFSFLIKSLFIPRHPSSVLPRAKKNSTGTHAPPHQHCTSHYRFKQPRTRLTQQCSLFHWLEEYILTASIIEADTRTVSRLLWL